MSGSEPLNPYESPTIPTEAEEKKAAPIGVIANFVMDAAGLKASARTAYAPIPAWVHWVSPLFILFIGAGLYFANAAAGPLGTIGFLVVVFGTLIFVQSLRNRRVARVTLERLQADPILGAMGNWRLTVDQQQIKVETPGGQQSFPRATTHVQALEAIDLVIWLGQLPILIPEKPPYARMCKMLRLWFIQTAPAVQK
jgi:hypothetical protein